MKKVLYIEVFVLSLIFSQPILASIPIQCPDSQVIKSIPLDYVEREPMGNGWAAVIKSNYFGSDKTWSFAIGGIVARDAKDAKDKAIQIMNKMVLKEGPIVYFDKSLCVYHSGNDAHPVALSPPA